MRKKHDSRDVIKFLCLTIAGIMIAVPVKGNIASTDYVDRSVADIINGISGSLLSGYISGSGSYVLIGSSTGGPYGGKHMSGFSDDIAPYLGSKISGVQGSTISFGGGTGFRVIASPGGSYYSGMTPGSVGSYLATAIPGSMLTGWQTYAEDDAPTGITHIPVIYDNKVVGITIADFRELLGLPAQ
ncbi:MAG: hypothetical protein LBF28_02535 [Rickettsiales bacterium]|jgi:hypothetical protein|nr:hypothetical protein [Rickettsiales bacterium]